MILTTLSGLMMIAREPGLLGERFFQVKLAAALMLTLTHVLLARYRRAFAQDRNIHSATFFRFLNEVPTMLMIIIVVMVFVHPWA
jgi:putative membrane protein